MDLFGQVDINRSFEDVLKELSTIAEGFVAEFELPERSVVVFENIGKGKDNKGDVISYSVLINEPAYPATADEMKDENRTHIPLLTIKKKVLKKPEDKFLVVTVGQSVLGGFQIPGDAEIQLETKSDQSSFTRRINFNINSPTFFDWVKSIIRYRITNFVSAADIFGCCSRFKECSDAKKCIHPNRLYSTACQYRHNLESGKIFYGKNKNV